MSGQSGGHRLLLSKLNDQLKCTLCSGYLIDATTIIECLHSFCRSCIVKYLEVNKYCPICEVLVHKSKPLLNIRPDHTLQDIVYKLVPGCYQNEMRCRKEFYGKHPEGKNLSMSPESRGEPIESHIYSPDESLSLSLEYYSPIENSDVKTDDVKEVTKSLPRRYLRCPAAVTIFHLQKLIRAKYGLTDAHRVDIMYKEEALSGSYTLMDVMYIYHWRRKVPLHLSYRIFESSPKRIKLAEDNNEFKQSLTNSGISSLESRDEQTTKRGWKEVQLKISETGVMSVTDITSPDSKKSTKESESNSDFLVDSVATLPSVNKIDEETVAKTSTSKSKNLDLEKKVPQETKRKENFETKPLEVRKREKRELPIRESARETKNREPVEREVREKKDNKKREVKNKKEESEISRLEETEKGKKPENQKRNANVNAGSKIDALSAKLQFQPKVGQVNNTYAKKTLKKVPQKAESKKETKKDTKANESDSTKSETSTKKEAKNSEEQKDNSETVSKSSENISKILDVLTKNAENSKKPEVAKNAENSKKPEVAKNAENSKKPDVAKNAENSKKPDVVKNAENSKKPDVVKNAENSKKPDVAKNAENSKKPDIAKNDSTKTETLKTPKPVSRNVGNVTKNVETKKVETLKKTESKSVEIVKTEETKKTENVKSEEISKNVENAIKIETSRNAENFLKNAGVSRGLMNSISTYVTAPSISSEKINPAINLQQALNSLAKSSDPKNLLSQFNFRNNNLSPSSEVLTPSSGLNVSTMMMSPSSNFGFIMPDLGMLSPASKSQAFESVPIPTSQNQTSSSKMPAQSSSQLEFPTSKITTFNVQPSMSIYSISDKNNLYNQSSSSTTTTTTSSSAKSDFEITSVPMSLMKSSRKHEVIAKGTNLNEICAKIGTSGSKINDICAKIGENSKEKNKTDTTRNLPDLLKITKSSEFLKHIPNIPNVPIYTPNTKDLKGSSATSQKTTQKKQTHSGYKTLRDPPKSWNPTLSKNNYVAVKNQSQFDGGGSKSFLSKPAKIFKMRNVPRYLGNPASGVKPMYGVSNEKEKEVKSNLTGSPMMMMKIDPKTLSPIVSTSNSPIVSPPPYSPNARSYQNSPFSRDICRNSGSPISPRNSPVNMLSTNPFIPSPTPNTNPRLIYSHFPPPFPDTSRFPNPLIRSPVGIPPPSAFHSSLPPSINKLYQRSSYIPQTSGYNPTGLTQQPPTVQRIPPSPTPSASFNLGKNLDTAVVSSSSEISKQKVFNLSKVETEKSEINEKIDLDSKVNGDIIDLEEEEEKKKKMKKKQQQQQQQQQQPSQSIKGAQNLRRVNQSSKELKVLHQPLKGSNQALKNLHQSSQGLNQSKIESHQSSRESSQSSKESNQSSKELNQSSKESKNQSSSESSQSTKESCQSSTKKNLKESNQSLKDCNQSSKESNQSSDSQREKGQSLESSQSSKDSHQSLKESSREKSRQVSKSSTREHSSETSKEPMKSVESGKNVLNDTRNSKDESESRQEREKSREQEKIEEVEKEIQGKKTEIQRNEAES